MGEIIFREGFLCNTDYSYGLPVTEIIDGTNAVTSYFGQYNQNSSGLTYDTNGLVTKNTIHFDDETIWRTTLRYQSGLSLHLTPSQLQSACVDCWANGTKHINLLCIPFASENQQSYFIIDYYLTYYSNSYHYYEGNIRIGWCNKPNFGLQGASGNTTTIISGFYVRLDYREDLMLDVQMWNNSDWAKLGPTGLHKNKTTAFLITLCTSSPAHNPDGTSPYMVNWGVDANGYLSMSTSSINNNTFSYVLSLAACQSLGFGDPGELDRSEEAGPPSEEGGMGANGENPSFDDSSDTVALPADPTLGVSNIGFINVYNCGSNSLQNMGVELFPPLQYSAPTPIVANDVTDAVVNGFNTLVTFFANIPSFFEQLVANALINYIIDCHVIPVTPTGGTLTNVVVGYKTLEATATKISNDYVTKSCGSINIREYYANFADFITTAKLYLPFVGFVPVRAEWFQNDTLKVDYKFNVIDGSFVCYVRSGGKYVNNGDSTGTIVAQYSGNACVHLPITGVTYANMVSGIVGGSLGAISSAAAGNAGAVVTSAINAFQSHGDIVQSNSYSATGAFLGCRYPFLMIERPVSSYSKNYQHELGIPANIYAKLGDVSGFVKMENVHVDGITGATDEEKEEIRRLLASGVIV